MRGMPEDLREYKFSYIVAQDPQHPADGRKACSGKRGTDELYCLQGNSRAGGVSDWCARVPSSLLLSVAQKVGIESLQEEYKTTD